MLDPREGRGEVVPGETADGFRSGREDEVEEERDGGSEFKSGDMLNWTMKRTMFSKDRVSKKQPLTEARCFL